MMRSGCPFKVKWEILSNSQTSVMLGPFKGTLVRTKKMGLGCVYLERQNSKIEDIRKRLGMQMLRINATTPGQKLHYKVGSWNSEFETGQGRPKMTRREIDKKDIM